VSDLIDVFHSLYQIASILIVAITLLVVISIVYKSWRNGISPMPSSVHARQVVAKEVNQIAKTGTIIDIGSGFGTLVMYIAQHCPEWKIIGIENSPIPLWISRMVARITSKFKGISLNGVKLIKGNLYSYNYEEIDVIVCYLYPGAMKQLEGVFKRRLLPGTTIISICFALPGWEAERVITCRDMYRTKVYVYRVH
jgi:SAM-dependent methyltransferase